MPYDGQEMRATLSEQQKMAEILKKLGQDVADIYLEVADKYKDIVGSGEAWVKIQADLKDRLDNNIGAYEKMEPLLNKWKEGQVSVTSSIKDTTVALDDTYKSASKIVQVFGQLEKAASLMGGKTADIMWGIGEGIGKVAVGVAKITTDPIGGITSILSGLVEVGQALNKIDEYLAKMNRSVYDTNAALGRMGEYSNSLIHISSELGLKYVKSVQEVEKIVNSIAKAGVSSENLYSVTDRILELNLKWSELTPEKQIKMMSDYMKEFGMESTKAQNVVAGLYNTAMALKKDVIEELDITQFMDQVSQVALSTRRLNFEFGDAQIYVEAFVKHLGKTPDIVARSIEMAKAFMEFGQGNLGLQAAMMQQYGRTPEGQGVIAPGAIGMGAFLLNPEARRKAQIEWIQSMEERIAGGRGIDLATAPLETRRQVQAEAWQLGAAGGVLPGGISPVALATYFEAGPEEQKKILADLVKVQDKLKEDQKEMPGNIKDMVKHTTTLVQHAQIWTETQMFRSGSLQTYFQEAAKEEFRRTGRAPTEQFFREKGATSEGAEQEVKKWMKRVLWDVEGHPMGTGAAVEARRLETAREAERDRIKETIKETIKKKEKYGPTLGIEETFTESTLDQYGSKYSISVIRNDAPKLIPKTPHSVYQTSLDYVTQGGK